VEILSGVFEGRTLGTPISLVVYNRDMRPYDYSKLKDLYRPGHADYTYQMKYGHRDYRGGGRSSGRETAARVAAGAVARKLLAQKGIRVVSFARMIGGVWLDEAEPGIGDAVPAVSVDTGRLEDLRAAIYQSKVRCPHEKTAAAMAQAVQQAGEEQDSVGGIVEVHAHGVTAGLGDPVFGKIDARLAHAVLSLGAVKGIEFGRGFRLAEMRGSQANDRFIKGTDGTVVPESNRAGGVAGGISTGLPIVFRAAVKPTASIAQVQKTVDATGKAVDLTIEGRHDPCIVIRIVPVIEHMVNLVLIDLMLAQQALHGWD
jgi:chorismate synthase